MVNQKSLQKEMSQKETSITMEETTDNDSDFSANEKNVPTLAKMKIRDDDEVIVVNFKLPI